MTGSQHVSSAMDNLKWGVKGGVGFALFYCAWVGALYLVAGSEALSRQGVSLTTIMSTYLCVGVVAGAVVGLLRPLTKNGFGAFVVGYIAAVPVTAGLVVCLNGWPTTWTARWWHEFPILVLVFGTMVGLELSRRAGGPRARSHPKK